MKKIFTLCLAFLGLSGAANAATVDDVKLCKHSYVLVADDYTNSGTEKIAQNALFGSGYFYTPTGNDKATNKGVVDLSQDTTAVVTAEIKSKYGEYGSHMNSLRLKNNQDYFAIRLTAKSKVIIFYENNKQSARFPAITKEVPTASSNKITNALSSEANVIATAEIKAKGIGRFEWTADDDGLYYVAANNQIYISYLIVEANEAPGTPTVKVGDQTFENGLYFQEVSCQANDYVMEGSDAAIPTVVFYTTDGTDPTDASTKYTEPIKCYSDMTVRFQAYSDLMGDGSYLEKIDGADYDVPVEFSFDAPAIAVNGADVTFSSKYENATNYYSLNGGEEAASDAVTLDESATVKAYSVISNGSYGSFTSKSVSQDVYVLNAIKEAKTIKVTAGDVVVDEEATQAATDGKTVYVVENGAISADKADFFVKNLEFGVVKDEKYQIDGNEAYIKMNSTNISFKVAAGDKVNVKVVCSKNSCKNIDADDAAADKQVNGNTPDRSCYVNVSGTNYCAKDDEGKEVCDMKLHPDSANVIEFTLEAGEADKVFTFQKYSGTGNILINSIEITPASDVVMGDVNGDKNVTMADANAIVNYFLAEDKATVNGFNAQAANVNGDDDITMADANAVVNMYLNSGSEQADGE